MIDLRSDTVTQPTEAMLLAQHDATMGDDSRDGDPTVMRLEAEAARMLGKEAGLFVVSGTMGNLVALLAHGRRGEVLTDAGSHLLKSELGGMSLLGGLFPRVLPAVRGAMDLDALHDHLRPDFTPTKLATALVWMETTHNDAGGAVLPLAGMQAVGEMARAAGVPTHIDGARFFNAAAALGADPAVMAACADSVTFCLSKGLSAPIGSMLVGSAAFIQRARAFRRMCGGALRQAGGLAGAGLVALSDMVDRLPEDHAMARRLALGLAAIDRVWIDPSEIESNIVRIDVSRTGLEAATWVERLKQHGISVGAWSRWQIRAVTHRHIGVPEIDASLQAFAAVRSMTS